MIFEIQWTQTNGFETNFYAQSNVNIPSEHNFKTPVIH